jgi:hypothetical protein
MIYHTVWFKLKDNITAGEKQELQDNLLAMIPEIPQILELACGEDYSGRSRGFQFGLVVKFARREDGQITTSTLSTRRSSPSPIIYGRMFRPWISKFKSDLLGR